MKKYGRINYIAVLLSLFLIPGCASGPQRGFVKSQSDYKQVFQASIDAANDIGFSIASADDQSGRILAEQGVSGGGGKVTRINITVVSTSGGSEVQSVFIQPPGTISYGNYGVDSYLQALAKRLPDAEIVSAPD